jgi:diketogulonate reductase-like aldo/keto reductase
VLGLGTWRMAEDARRRADELSALRLGLDLGMTVVDTAEMYGDGDAEQLVGEAIRGRRDDVFLVSKVLPSNAEADAMAYSPIEQGRLLDHPALRAVAACHDATPAQVVLAWVLRHDGVVTVPKAGAPDHVRENCGALELQLTDQDLGELDVAFPPPAGSRPLEL